MLISCHDLKFDLLVSIPKHINSKYLLALSCISPYICREIFYSLRPAHYITLAIAVLLIAYLYWGGNTMPPSKPEQSERPTGMPMGGGGGTVKAASFDSILAASRAALPQTASGELANIEKELAAIHDSSKMAAIFVRMAHVWEINKFQPVAAYYGAKAAKLENSQKKLNFAGQFFLDLMHGDSISQSVQLWEANEAIECFKRSLEIEPDNDTTKLLLASTYIDGTGETMQGVQMLLALTREKPDNLPANLLLGRLAVKSGQFDKAIKRFEGILAKYPDNSEALYFMAEAYKGKGDKQKAIELFEKCKKIVNKPEFSREIDQYINSFK